MDSLCLSSDEQPGNVHLFHASTHDCNSQIASSRFVTQIPSNHCPVVVQLLPQEPPLASFPVMIVNVMRQRTATHAKVFGCISYRFECFAAFNMTNRLSLVPIVHGGITIVQGFRNSPFGIFSSFCFAPRPKRALWNSSSFLPYRTRLGFSSYRQINSYAPIVQVFLARNPPTVFRAISFIIVFSVEFQPALISVINRPSKKGLKLLPFLANCNATCPIIFVCLAFWVLCPLFHRLPCPV